MKRNWKQVAGYAVFVAATISVVMAIRSGAPDRAAVVPDMKVLFENECVRVQYHDVAIGQTIPMHSHPNYIVYVLKPFKARITLPDGMQRISERKAGETYWNEAITRSVENIGSSDIHNLIIKLKASARCH